MKCFADLTPKCKRELREETVRLVIGRRGFGSLTQCCLREEDVHVVKGQHRYIEMGIGSFLVTTQLAEEQRNINHQSTLHILLWDLARVYLSGNRHTPAVR